MRRYLLVSIVIALTVSVAACSRDKTDKTLAPKPFCEAVAKLDFDIGYVKPAEQLKLVENVAAIAPAAIKADAETFLEGMQKVVGNGETISDDAQRSRYEDATNRLQRYAIDHCALLNQGGSSPFSGNS